MTNAASPPVSSRLVSRLKGGASSSVMQKYAPFLQQSGTPAQQPPVAPLVTQPMVATAPPPLPDLTDAEKLDLFEATLADIQPDTAPLDAYQPPSVQSQTQPQDVVPTTAVADPVVPTQDSSAQDPSVFPQVVPGVVQQASDTLNPSFAATSAKEVFERGTFDQVTGEVGGLQHVEQEVSPEISPEISEYIQKVEEQIAQQPQEIVINPQGDTGMQAVAQPQPVVVLPITPEIEAFGAKQKTTFSVRWLVEWSRKLMKIFSGKIMYRQT